MAVQVELLKSITYFSGLSLNELGRIKDLIFEKAADKGELVLFEGKPAEVLYFIVSGVVKVFKTSADGKEQTLYFMRPDESFNDVSVLVGGQNMANAGALVPVVLYGIRKDDLEAVIRDYPQVARNVILALSQKVERLVSLVENLSFRHVPGRVAKILLEYAGDRDGRKPRLTHQEMAAIAGTAREMIGRALKVIEEEGAVRLERQRIVITDKEALQEMAGVAT
ncbi:MAG: Crp/Fnr family transcriptional regulator [Dehalococcoidales bacterium]|jgi:CRP/FNR family transcriptional regulator|nr:Crp/Fnr family transcriptional regulator [Dehalococcoidales bacterium]